jgi:hypothetical protein
MLRAQKFPRAAASGRISYAEFTKRPSMLRRFLLNKQPMQIQIFT